MINWDADVVRRYCRDTLGVDAALVSRIDERLYVALFSMRCTEQRYWWYIWSSPSLCEGIRRTRVEARRHLESLARERREVGDAEVREWLEAALKVALACEREKRRVKNRSPFRL